MNTRVAADDGRIWGPASASRIGVAAVAAGGGLAGFLAYQEFRGWRETFGFDLGIAVGSAVPALVFFVAVPAVLLWGIVCLIRLFELEQQERRAGRGRCVECGYELGVAGASCCPECGAAACREPRPQHLRAGRLAAAMLVAALAGGLAGCAAGELWMLADEAGFQREAAAYLASGGTGSYARSRAWPNGNCSLIFEPPSSGTPGGRFRATE